MLDQLLTLRSWWHQQSLARQFALAAAGIILPGTLLTGYFVGQHIKQGVAESSAASAILYIDNVVSPAAVRVIEEPARVKEVAAELDAVLAPLIGRRLSSLNIWSTDGRVAYSTRKELVGRSFPPTNNFKRALSGHIAAEFEGRTHQGDAYDKSPNMRLEIYAPILKPGAEDVIAVAELYSIREGLAAELRQATVFSWLFVGAIGAAMMAALSGIVARGSRTIETQARQLRQHIDELETLLEENAELNERLKGARQRTVAITEQQLRRVGADLHDGPAQMIGLSLLMLDGGKSVDDPVQEAANEKVRSTLTEALRDIRAISNGLIMPEIAASPLDGLVRHVARAHERRTATKVAVEIKDGAFDVPLPLKSCVYRVLQEALNNSWRHAEGKGQAITLVREGNDILISVRDEGPGLQQSACKSILRGQCLETDGANGVAHEVSQSAGMGLVGLRDRVETIGGQLDIVSTERGTALTVRFDLEEVHRLAAEQI